MCIKRTAETGKEHLCDEAGPVTFRGSRAVVHCAWCGRAHLFIVLLLALGSVSALQTGSDLAELSARRQQQTDDDALPAWIVYYLQHHPAASLFCFVGWVVLITVVMVVTPVLFNYSTTLAERQEARIRAYRRSKPFLNQVVQTRQVNGWNPRAFDDIVSIYAAGSDSFFFSWYHAWRLTKFQVRLVANRLTAEDVKQLVHNGRLVRALIRERLEDLQNMEGHEAYVYDSIFRDALMDLDFLDVPQENPIGEALAVRVPLRYGTHFWRIFTLQAQDIGAASQHDLEIAYTRAIRAFQEPALWPEGVRPNRPTSGMIRAVEETMRQLIDEHIPRPLGFRA